MPIVQCKLCNKDFYTKPNWIKIGGGRFCSRLCQYESYKRGRMVECFLCKKKVYKKLQALKRTDKYFCTKSCQTKWRNVFFSGSRHANWRGGKSIAYRRTMARHNIPKVCRLCQTVDARVLAVHHIDFDHSNNDIKNLMWLCHNCHFLIHHYNEEREKLMVPIA